MALDLQDLLARHTGTENPIPKLATYTSALNDARDVVLSGADIVDVLASALHELYTARVELHEAPTKGELEDAQTAAEEWEKKADQLQGEIDNHECDHSDCLPSDYVCEDCARYEKKADKLAYEVYDLTNELEDLRPIVEAWTPTIEKIEALDHWREVLADAERELRRLAQGKDTPVTQMRYFYT